MSEVYKIYYCSKCQISKQIKENDVFDGLCKCCKGRMLLKKTVNMNKIKESTPDILQYNKPKCPTCGSTNIKKISGIERGASIAAFGIFSKKINKTFKCNNCGYTW